VDAGPLLLALPLLPFLGYAWNLFGDMARQPPGRGSGEKEEENRNNLVVPRPACTLDGEDESAMNRPDVRKTRNGSWIQIHVYLSIAVARCLEAGAVWGRFYLRSELSKTSHPVSCIRTSENAPSETV
jgi:hypothetical protein